MQFKPLEFRSGLERYQEQAEELLAAQSTALELADAHCVSGPARGLLRKGALLHDIGKISVPDAILDKPGKLTVAEFEVVTGHAAQGAHTVEQLHALRETLPLIRSHHERLDGKGYPDGLRGERIATLERILSVAYVYDALSSERHYRQSLPHPRCLEMLRENAHDGGLDAELVSLFSTIVTPLPTRLASVPAPAPSFVLTS